MSNFTYFNNIGYLETRLPDELLASLQTESLRAPEQNDIMISGLSGNGVPKHINVEANRAALERYIISLIPQYEEEFNHSRIDGYFDEVPPIGLGEAWFNYQQRYEFVPVHRHSGIYSFVTWLNIPYNIEEELSSGLYASCFDFIYTSTLGDTFSKTLPVSKDWVGKILLFPSSLRHTVYPFYTSTGTRVSLSGNIIFKNNAF